MLGADLIEAHYSKIQLTAEDMDHDEWFQAEPVLIHHYWSGEVAPTNRHAQARIIWNDEALCVRFDCRQEEPLIVHAAPRTDRKTIGLWERDVSELFLAPDANRPDHYYEFEAAPTGEWLDLEIEMTVDGRITDWDFQSDMKTATRIASSRTVIAMCIPWSNSIPKPNVGEEWRANLCRCVGDGPFRGYLAWQPTYADVPNFHVPSAFGRMSFVE
jgi:alpha-galactosidase